MTFEFDDQEDRHTLAELLKAFQNAPLSGRTTELPRITYIDKNGYVYHGMTRLIADIKKPRPDFRAAGWMWG